MTQMTRIGIATFLWLAASIPSSNAFFVARPAATTTTTTASSSRRTRTSPMTTTTTTRKKSVLLFVGKDIEKDVSKNTNRTSDNHHANDEDVINPEVLESLHDEFQQLMALQQEEQQEQQEQQQPDDFQFSVQDMQDPSIWMKSQVFTGRQDPLMKTIASTISDPELRIMSSEIGVKDFVRKEIKPHIPDSSQLPIDVLFERTMDTIEDVMVHLRRMPYDKGLKSLSPEEEASRKTVVVLGSGWAAHALMKVADCTKLRLIVVSPSNHFVFTPMLASSAVGTVEYRSMTEAVRAANPMMDEYIEGKAVGIDVHQKKINVQLNSLLEEFREGDPPTLELDYDHLIVSVGCKVDDKGVPGADKALRLKTCDDSVRLRRAIGECLEYASRPDVAGPDKALERTRRATFLIVGGGPTGIELAGEIMDLANDITRPHKGAYPKLKDNIRVIVAHSGPELVPQFDQRLRQAALESLEKKGAKVYLNTRVNELGEGFAKLSTKIIDPQTGEVVGKEDVTLDTGLAVWCAGTAPVSFVNELLEQLPEEARNYDGRIKVDQWMRPAAMPRKDLLGSILVLGDAAAFPENAKDITIDKLLPQTAQVAGQQGAYAARMLDRGYDLTATPPALPQLLLSADSSVKTDYAIENNTNSKNNDDVFDDPLMTQWLQVRGLDMAPRFVFLNLGLLAYLGGGEALTQVQIGDFPLFSYFGSVAFVLWRSVYLVKQVATRNRVLVTFDWIKSAVFGRDTTRF